MVNNNNVDNTNIQAIRTPICSSMSNKCLKCGKSHAFHREACPALGSKCNTCGKANHWASVCLSNGTKPKKKKKRPRSQSKEHKKTKSHNQSQYRRKQSVKTDAVYNNRDEAFVIINIKLPNRNGTHKLRLKIDTGAQGNTLPVSTFRRMFTGKLDTDGFPNIKLTIYQQKTNSLQRHTNTIFW